MSNPAPPLRPPPGPKRAGPSAWQWVAIIVGALIVIGIVAGGAGSGGDKKKAPTKPSAPFRATSSQARAFVADHLRGGPNDGARVRDAICSRGSCTIIYDTGGIVGIDAPRELLDQQRDIFRKLFSDRSINAVLLVAWGQVTTVGGKNRTAPVLRVRCARSAADQIDWGNVDVGGMKALCDWTPMVKL